MDVCTLGLRLDYRLRLQSSTSTSRAISVVAELLVLHPTNLTHQLTDRTQPTVLAQGPNPKHSLHTCVKSVLNDSRFTCYVSHETTCKLRRIHTLHDVVRCRTASCGKSRMSMHIPITDFGVRLLL